MIFDLINVCSRVLCVLWAQGQVDQVLLVLWVRTILTHTTQDHHSK